MKQHKDTITLTLPSLSDTNMRTVYAQVRPYRKGGIRLQHQQINGKHVFHNYGHGGAGISLAYGSSYVSAKQLTIKTQQKHANCAVIGSGIMGLMTALQLAKRGYNVTIYSQKFPSYGEKNNENCITSQIAPGLWLPYWYDNNDIIKHELLSMLSYQFYNECVQLNKYQSLRKCYVYDRCYTVQEHYQNKIFQQLLKTFEKVKVNFVSGGLTEEYLRFETVQINVELFLEELKTEAILRGVKLIQRSFKDLNDVLSLDEAYIMNCSGMGSKKLFGDNNLIGSRGHLLEYINQSPKQINYILRYKKTVPPSVQGDPQKEYFIDLYCHNHRVLIGQSKQIGQQQPIVQNNQAEQMKMLAQSFILERTMKPKL